MVVAAPIGVAQDALVAPHESVAGVSQREWSVRWWQWAASFQDYARSPVADQDGANCAQKQDGPVWFLAGTYGSRRTIRTCTIPAGRHLFFPLVNYVVFPRQPRSGSCDEYIVEAAAVTDAPSTLVLELDGTQFERLTRYRQATTECFDLGARSDPPAGIHPAAANGYYVLLRPLSRGTHTLNFGGVLPSITQAVTYTLIVE